MVSATLTELRYVLPETVHIRLQGALADQSAVLRDAIVKKLPNVVTFTSTLVDPNDEPLLEIKIRPGWYVNAYPKIVAVVEGLVAELGSKPA